MFPKETKILIIDDMMTMRKLVRKSLQDLGFANVAESPDGEKAWPEIQNAAGSGAPFQLIISDWNMPGLTGIELLKRLRSTDSVKATPFILLTAEAEKEQVAMAMEAGVSAYITKPFAPATLQEKMAAVWAKK